AAEVSAQVLTNSGTYQIICRSAEGNTTGNYALALVNDPGSNLNERVIQPGQTLAGGIVLGELDVFTFTATVGQRVSIVITASGSSMTPRIQLRGPDGSLVADKSGFPTAEVSAQVLNQSGTYQIICRSAEGNTTANYALALVNDPGSNLNERIIQPGQTLAGGIVLGELDVFTFSACQGERITIVMTASGSSMTPRIQLRGPGGSLVADKSGWPAAEVSVQVLNQSGTYQIICRSAEGNTTDGYALTTSRHFWPNVVDVGGGGIQSGESKLGNITLGD